MSKELLDLLKGLYPYFLWMALIGIIWRAYQKKWTRCESAVLAVYLGFVTVTALQPYWFYGELEIFRRYLLIGVPLYLGWAAYALRQGDLRFEATKKYAVLTTLVITVLTGLLLLDAAMPIIKNHTSGKKGPPRTATLQIARQIRADWSGKELTATPVLKCDVYRSPQRPLIQSDIRALGYLAGGQQYELAAFIPGTRPDYIVIAGNAPTPPGATYTMLTTVTAGKQTYQIWCRNPDR